MEADCCKWSKPSAVSSVRNVARISNLAVDPCNAHGSLKGPSEGMNPLSVESFNWVAAKETNGRAILCQRRGKWRTQTKN